jgi:hypothetical protein
MQTGTFDEEGNFIPPDNSGVPLVEVITRWDLPDPQPTIAELDQYAASVEYLSLSLALAKSSALDRLNAWRGQQRQALRLTKAEFQELVYTGKAIECQRWLAAPETPFGLAAEATARDLSNEEMAAMVLAQHAAWLTASDAIEAAYWTVKVDVEAAQTGEEIEAILAGDL